VTSSATSAPAPLLFAEVEQRIRAAVARVAAAEPDPLDPYRGLYISDEGALRTAAELDGHEVGEALGHAAALLGLGTLDAAVLAFCAAPELDARYGRLIAYLHDDVTRRLPTPRLVARLLAGDGLPERALLARFGADAPLRRTGAVSLLDSDPLVPLADRPAKLDERLAARLIGAELGASPDPRGARLVAVPACDPGRAEAVAALRRLIASGDELALVACGTDGPELIALALDRPVLVLDARAAAEAGALPPARVHAALAGAALVLELPETAAPEDQARIRGLLEGLGGRLLACAARRQGVTCLDGAAAMVVDVPAPSLEERRALWATHSGAGTEEVAEKFRLSMRQIEHAARIAGLAARARGAEEALTADLERGAREASRTRLGELAALLDDRRDWSDLVLPAAQRDQLRSISAYLRHRDRVLSDWGYEDAVSSQGLKVLFAGESGTGKTMAAQVIATDLGLDVFRVDLATVVSKYIGETERNLDRIFGAAEGSNAILFFDEADALFGKRSEVKDAHDRYANIEVSYLLQRMETYPGAVVLATNYRRNIDEAFMRRLDFAIDFPFPEPADRERIWRRLLPDSAPVGPDVDVEALARRFELSGGSIRNCSVAAAFMAADDGGRIEMRHLVGAVAGEYRKIGRLTLDAEFAGDGSDGRPI
jgi:hypothetical protein